MGRLARYLVYLAALTLAYDAALYLSLTEGWVPSFLIGLLFSPRMFLPALATVMVIGTDIEGLKALGLIAGRRKASTVALAIATPYALWGVGLAVASLMGIAPVDPIGRMREVTPLSIPMSDEVLFIILVILPALVGPTLNALFALGEEIGWRGLMYVELSTSGAVLRSTLTGLAWAAWHFPLILAFGYNYPLHRDAIGLIAYTALLIPFSAIMDWLRGRSGSILGPSVLHGTFNGLAGSMALSLAVEDSLWGLPVGVPGIVVMWILAAPILLSSLSSSRGQR